MDQDTIDRWMSETPNPKKLPYRIKKKKKKMKKSVVSGIQKVAAPMDPEYWNTGKVKVNPNPKIQGLRVDQAAKVYNNKVVASHALRAAAAPKLTQSLGKVIMKTAENLADQALEESKLTMQDRIPGAAAKANASTGQAKSRVTRTGVQSEDRSFSGIFSQSGKGQKSREGADNGGQVYQGV